MNDLEYRNKMIDELRNARTTQKDLIDEYIEEAEGLEGIKYWHDFDTVADMLADFDLFVETLED